MNPLQNSNEVSNNPTTQNGAPSVPAPPPVMMQPQPPMTGMPTPQLVIKPPTSGLAVTAMATGIVFVISAWCGGPFTIGFSGLLAVIPISFAGVALRKIKQTGIGGKGMAVTGLVLGIIALVPLLLGVLFITGVVGTVGLIGAAGTAA